MPTTELFRDDFNRTVGPTVPWSPGDWGPKWVLNSISTGGTAWVDGAAGRLSASNRLFATPVDSENFRALSGIVEFDFYVSADPADFRPYIWTRQGKDFPVLISVWSEAGTTWRAEVSNYGSSDTRAGHSFVAEASTWYRLKGYFNGVAGGGLGVKVWKRDDAEPGLYQGFGTAGHVAYTQAEWLANIRLQLAIWSPTSESGAVDNYVITETDTAPPVGRRSSLTAAAVLKKSMSTETATLDAEIVARHFFAGAWIIGRRSGHSRFLDHFGTQPDTVVVLDGAIEKYPSGTDVHTVLTDIVARITSLETSNHRVFTFSMGAFIQPYFTASAVVKKTMAFAGIPGGDYDIRRGCLDARIVADGFRVNRSFPASAQITRQQPGSFGASAYIIDLVC